MASIVPTEQALFDLAIQNGEFADRGNCLPVLLSPAEGCIR